MIPTDGPLGHIRHTKHVPRRGRRHRVPERAAAIKLRTSWLDSVAYTGNILVCSIECGLMGEISISIPLFCFLETKSLLGFGIRTSFGLLPARLR